MNHNNYFKENKIILVVVRSNFDAAFFVGSIISLLVSSAGIYIQYVNPETGLLPLGILLVLIFYRQIL